jgi:hypothetical protein
VPSPAVDIVQHWSKYEFFIFRKLVKMPMMYMDDAIAATIQIGAGRRDLRYVLYNLAAMSFTPTEIAEIKTLFSKFYDYL